MTFQQSIYARANVVEQVHMCDNLSKSLSQVPFCPSSLQKKKKSEALLEIVYAHHQDSAVRGLPPSSLSPSSFGDPWGSTLSPMSGLTTEQSFWHR